MADVLHRFVPTNLNQARLWFMGGDYSLKRGFRRDALEFYESEIRECYRTQKLYLVNYEKASVIHTVAFKTCPIGMSENRFKIKMGFFESLKRVYAYYFRNFFRISAAGTFGIANTLLVLFLHSSLQWLSKQTVIHHFFTTDTCNDTCASLLVNSHSVVILTVTVLLFGCAWPPAFYFFNRNKIRHRAFKTLMVLEATFLSYICLLSLVHFVSAFPFRTYERIVFNPSSFNHSQMEESSTSR